MSSQAIVVSEPVSRRIELEVGDVSLSEKQIVDAIFKAFYEDDEGQGASDADEVEEIVAQLFDALEEKNIEEHADLEEYVASLAGPAYCSDCVEDLQQKLDDEIATVVALESELDTLANFIMKSVAGEPSQNQGAVDTAIRVMKTQNDQITKLCDTILRIQEQSAQLTIVARTLNDELKEYRSQADANWKAESKLREELDETKKSLAEYQNPPIGIGGTLSYTDGTCIGKFKDLKITYTPTVNTTPVPSLPASFTLKNDVPTPYQEPKSGPATPGCDCPECVEYGWKAS